MQLKWLEDFVALSETLSFTRAAELRHVTHPAFGRRIKALEDWVGAELVDRSGYPAKLTPAGKEFLAAAQEALAALREARESLGGSAQAKAQSLTIATGRTLSRTLFPAWLMRTQAALRSQRSGLGANDAVAPRTGAKAARVRAGHFHADVWTGSLHDAVLRLEQGLADFVFCYGHPRLRVSLDPARFAFRVVGQERIVAVCAPDSLGKPRYALKPSAKTPVPYLELAPSLAMARLVEAEVIRPRKLKVAPVYRSDFAEPLHMLAREGEGLAWLPLTLVQEDLRAKRLVRMESEAHDVVCEVRLYRALDNAKPLVEAIWQTGGVAG
jgi:LysR family transcriptional regulator, hypochlorite-specific transcription factor HypT